MRSEDQTVTSSPANRTARLPAGRADLAAAPDLGVTRPFARRLDPGLTDRDFADAAERLDHWGDGVFASFGLGPDGIVELRVRFAAWPRT